jgi:hypoxanthine phosphoribosyltransferase
MAKVESFKCRLVSYDEISKWTEDIANKIEDDGTKATVIVGLTRGGWVPARLLCDHLSVKKLYAVKTEHWGVTANLDGKALLTQELNVSIKNESVIVVDDITDTGESLGLAKASIAKMGPKQLKTATLLHIAHSKIEPDYYSVMVPKDEWTWFIFPWNLHEDMRTLLPKTLTEPRSAPGIKVAFKKQFQIEVPTWLIKETLKVLEATGKVKESSEGWVPSG